MVNDELITNYDIGIKHQEYKSYLQSLLGEKHIEILQRNTHKGLPCGNDDFIAKLGNKIGKNLSFRGIGRPKKHSLVNL